MKTPTLLLRASENGLEAWQLQAQGLSHEASFEPDAHQAFGAWLGTRPTPPRLRLLLDFADDGFETESLPRSRGRDRRALIERRLATHFDASPVSWSRSLGRDPAAPHLERLQFYGLTRPGLLSPWLEACHDAGVQLDAVCPAALLLEHLAPRALQLREECLLVSFGGSGMRLSHFRDARLRFSRLVPGVQAAKSPPDTRWRDEIRRTRSYLNAQRDGARSGPLPVIVLAAGLDPADPAEALQFRDPATLGRTALAAGQPGDTDAALLHALQHAPRPLHCHWAGRSTSLQAPHLPLALGSVGIVLCLTCLTVAALRWADAAALDHEAAGLETRSATLRREQAQIEAARPPLPTTPAALLELVTQIEREQAGGVDTAAVFRTVSAALDATPGLDLVRLSWQRAGNEAQTAATTAATTSATADVTTDTTTAVALQLELIDDPALPAPTARLGSLIEHLQRHGLQALQHPITRSGSAAEGQRVDLRFELAPGARP
jgi:hypothetical protein